MWYNIPLHLLVEIELIVVILLHRYMTVREQKLQERRRCAEELLAWKRKLDEEEACVEQLEIQAMAMMKKKNEKLGWWFMLLLVIILFFICMALFISFRH